MNGPTPPDSFQKARGALLNALLSSDSKYEYHIRVWEALEGSLKESDAATVSALLTSRNPKKILEVGGFLGLSSRFLLEATSAQIVSVDPNLRHRIFDGPQEVQRRLCEMFLSERFIQITGFFATRAYENRWYLEFPPTHSEEAIRSLVSETPLITSDVLAAFGAFDCILLDANHDLECTNLYYQAALPLLKKGGMVLLHDVASWPSVSTFVAQLRNGGNLVEVFQGFDGIGMVIPK